MIDWDNVLRLLGIPANSIRAILDLTDGNLAI